MCQILSTVPVEYIRAGEIYRKGIIKSYIPTKF